MGFSLFSPAQVAFSKSVIGPQILSVHQSHLKGFIKQIAGSSLRVSHSVDLRCDLRVCISRSSQVMPLLLSADHFENYCAKSILIKTLFCMAGVAQCLSLDL